MNSIPMIIEIAFSLKSNLMAEYMFTIPIIHKNTLSNTNNVTFNGGLLKITPSFENVYFI